MLGLDAHQAGDQRDHICRDCVNDVVLVVYVQVVVASDREWPLVADVLDDRVDQDTHQPDWHVLGVVVILLYDLNAKHGDQWADQHVDMLLLLRD